MKKCLVLFLLLFACCNVWAKEYSDYDEIIKGGFQCKYKLAVPYRIDFSKVDESTITEDERTGKYNVNKIEYINITAAIRENKNSLNISMGEGKSGKENKNWNGNNYWEFEKNSSGVYDDIEVLDSNYLCVFCDSSDQIHISIHDTFNPLGYLEDMSKSGYMCPSIINMKRQNQFGINYSLYGYNGDANGLNNNVTYELYEASIGINEEASTYYKYDIIPNNTKCLFNSPFVESCKSFKLKDSSSALLPTQNVTVELGELRSAHSFFKNRPIKYLYIKSDSGVAYGLYSNGSDLQARLNDVAFTIKKEDIDAVFNKDIKTDDLRIAYRTLKADDDLNTGIYVFIAPEDSATFSENNDPESILEYVDSIAWGEYDSVKTQIEIAYNNFKQNKGKKWKKCIDALENREYLLSEYERIKNILSGKLDFKELDKYAEGLKNADCSLNGTTNNTGVLTCNGLFGGPDSEVRKLIKNILDFVKYGGPILMILLTIVDLVKTVTSGDDKDFKKVFQNFLKRFIAAVLLFFINEIVGLLFMIVGIEYNCIVGE